MKTMRSIMAQAQGIEQWTALRRAEFNALPDD